jgi:hypothetical protein
MKTTLRQLITEYSMGNTELEGFEVSKDLFVELLSKYFNDKNSSTLREEVMCYVSGIESNPNKLGYDGKDSKDENKPKNFDTNNPKSKKLNGGGNYSDMTHKRNEKFILDKAVIHIGGFVDGKLTYQFKIPYVGLTDHFKKQLDKRLPNGDETNNYLRSMTFSISAIKECKDVSLEYLTTDIEKYRVFMTKTLYDYLIKLKKNESIK